MKFGEALEFAEDGQRVARSGWNGKKMWIAHWPGRKIEYGSIFPEGPLMNYASTLGGVEILPCLVMKTADGKLLMGWLASQTDMLADDWVVLDE